MSELFQIFNSLRIAEPSLACSFWHRVAKSCSLRKKLWLLRPEALTAFPMDTDLGEELSEGQDLHKADVRLERPGCPNQGTSRLPHIPGDPPPSPPAAALPARCGGGGPWPWPCPRCRPPCLCLPRAVSWKRPGSASSPAGWAATRPSPLRPFPVPSLPSRPVPSRR